MQRRNVKISSAQLHKEIFLKGAYSEVMGKIGEKKFTFNFNIAVHPDLRLAFNALSDHVIQLADLHDARGLVPIDKISIIGFNISGDGDDEGVVISATRELENLKLVAINTPFQAWNDQVTPYEEAGELSLLIEACKAEVYSYLFDEKHQPDNQMQLPFSNEAGAATGDEI